MLKSLFKVTKFLINHPLNDGYRLKSLLNFILWQIRSINTNNGFVFNWVNSTRFILKRGETGLTGNLYCGFMEYEDMCFLLHYLRPDEEFFDIGANVGSYTILASGVVKARSFTFEPIPQTFERLTDQIQINRICDLVTLENKGIGNKSGTLNFTSQFNCMNHVSNNQNDNEVIEVDVIALDNYREPKNTSIVKIDVEGFEYFVLDGGRNFFQNPLVECVIIEINGSGTLFDIEDDLIDSTLREFGFFPISYNPLNREINKIEKYNAAGNTIYLKNINDAIIRCKTAEFVTIHTAHEKKI